MSPQEGKLMTRKRRRADSHETLVISISSDSSDDSHFASLKKKKAKIGDPQPRFDLNLLPGENPWPQSEVAENSYRMPFFCSCPPTAVSSEWGRSTARFNGEDKWLRAPASIEELEDTASTKLATVERLDLNIPAEEFFLFNSNKLMEGVSQSEVGENSPKKQSCFPFGYDRQCFSSPVSDLEAAHSGVTAAAETRDLSLSDSEDSDLASSDSLSDSEDSDLASSDSSSDSGDSHHASSDRYSDSGDSRLAPLKEKRGDAQPNEIREIQQ